MKLVNKFNPGGIKETLKRWYLDPSKQENWVVFDGISVILVPFGELANCPHKSICPVPEIKALIEEEISLDEFLNNDY